MQVNFQWQISIIDLNICSSEQEKDELTCWHCHKPLAVFMRATAPLSHKHKHYFLTKSHPQHSQLAITLSQQQTTNNTYPFKGKTMRIVRCQHCGSQLGKYFSGDVLEVLKNRYIFEYDALGQKYQQQGLKQSIIEMVVDKLQLKEPSLKITQPSFEKRKSTINECICKTDIINKASNTWNKPPCPFSQSQTTHHHPKYPQIMMRAVLCACGVQIGSTIHKSQSLQGFWRLQPDLFSIDISKNQIQADYKFLQIHIQNCKIANTLSEQYSLLKNELQNNK